MNKKRRIGGKTLGATFIGAGIALIGFQFGLMVFIATLLIGAGIVNIVETIEKKEK
jgi:hypothetical protein